MRSATYATYEREVRRVEASELGELLASRLIGADVDAYLATLASGGREDGKSGGLAPKTRAHLRTTLHGAFKWAVRAGLTSRNPIADTQAIAVPEVAHAALSVEQVAAVLEALRGTRLEAAAILAAFAGLRRGESLAVRWRDLGPSGVHIRRQVVYDRTAKRVRFTALKTDAATALVPLPAPALAMLADLRRRRMNAALIAGRTFSEDELCTQRADGSPVNPDNAGAQFTRILTRKGLPGVHLHMLRHAYGSELAVRQGVDARTVQQLMRHSDVATTLRHYVTSDSAAQQAAAERLGEVWQQAAASRHHPDTTDAAVVDLDAHRTRKDAG